MHLQEETCWLVIDGRASDYPLSECGAQLSGGNVKAHFTLDCAELAGDLLKGAGYDQRQIGWLTLGQVSFLTVLLFGLAALKIRGFGSSRLVR